MLSQKAYDIGFVDINDINEIPVIEKYNDHYVKSLYFSVLQFIFPDLKIINNSLIIKDKKIALNKYMEMHVTYPQNDNLAYISLIDLLTNKVDKQVIQNKIVIMGYDGKNTPTINISTGNVNMHRVFIYGLFDMYNQLKEESD